MLKAGWTSYLYGPVCINFAKESFLSQIILVSHFPKYFCFIEAPWLYVTDVVEGQVSVFRKELR